LNKRRHEISESYADIQFFQLLLIASWIAMTVVGLISVGLIKNSNLKAGNPYRCL